MKKPALFHLREPLEAVDPGIPAVDSGRLFALQLSSLIVCLQASA